jgi:hypothetical protein
LVIADQPQGEFVVVVGPSVADLPMSDRDPVPGLSAVGRALALAGQGALCAGQAPLGSAQVAGVGDRLGRTVASGDRRDTRRPRSIPAVRATGGSGARSRSTTNEAKKRPSGSRMIVTLDGTDGSSRDQRTRTSPTLATYSFAPCNAKPLRVRRIDWRPRLVRNLGCPIRRPLRAPDRESNQLRYARRASWHA